MQQRMSPARILLIVCSPTIHRPADTFVRAGIDVGRFDIQRMETTTMEYFKRRRSSLGFAVLVPLLCSASLAQAAQCQGYKIVQSCSTVGGTPNLGVCGAYIGDIGGIQYQSCVASAPLIGGTQMCTPVKVPCDYPNDIFDAISRVFNPER